MEEERKPTTEHKPASTTELFSSAKVVAGAAQATFSNQSDKVDKAEVAAAGEDLLGAAKKYGNLDENQGIGQYVDKAESYLHQYHEKGSKHDDHPAGGGSARPEGKEEEEPPKQQEEVEKEKEGGGGGGGGLGGLVGGLTGGGGGGGGGGDLMNMAKGFLK